jgi:NADPH:quinone reductase-like Zn-dependent oxidoreductase
MSTMTAAAENPVLSGEEDSASAVMARTTQGAARDGDGTTTGAARDGAQSTNRTHTMKAIVQRRYGSPDVLELRDIDVPQLEDDRVLVRVRAASVNAADWHRMRGEPMFVRLVEGMRHPKATSIGSDIAGIVEAVGNDVTKVRPGDEVWGTTVGAFAEFARSREARLVPLPAGFTFEQAAAVPVAATTALQALRDKGNVQPGQAVLINGAGGGVGTFAVQIAKALGAVVTASTSTANLDMLRSIGADEVVDYTREDVTQRRGTFDLMLDIAGTRSISACRHALTPNGTYVVIGGPGGRWVRPVDRMLEVMVQRRFVSQRLLTFLAQIRFEDLEYLKGLMDAGKLSPVIDRTYPLSQTAEAMRYVEQGHARGKVVITM